MFHWTEEVVWCIWPSSDLWTIQEHQWLCQHCVVDTVFRHSNNFLMGMENVLLEALFSPLGIKNVFQDTKKFNVDSPIGTKKCLLSFKCLSKHKQLPNYFDLQSCQNNIFSIWELCLILLIVGILVLTQIKSLMMKFTSINVQKCRYDKSVYGTSKRPQWKTFITAPLHSFAL